MSIIGLVNASAKSKAGWETGRDKTNDNKLIVWTDDETQIAPGPGDVTARRITLRVARCITISKRIQQSHATMFCIHFFRTWNGSIERKNLLVGHSYANLA